MILRRKICERDLRRLRLHHGHIIDPDLSKIGSDDPPGLLIIRQQIVVFLCLLIWCFIVVTRLRLVQRNAKRFLFDQYMRLRDINVDAFHALIPGDLFFELHAIGHVLHAKDINQHIDPIRAGILIFFTLAVPFIIKLSGRFPLLRVSHCQHRPSF